MRQKTPGDEIFKEARALESGGRFFEAAKKYFLFRRGLSGEPKALLEAVLGEGRNLVSSGRIREGRVLMARWLERNDPALHPDERARFLSAIGYSHRLAGQPGEALKFLGRASEGLGSVPRTARNLISLKSVLHNTAGVLRDEKRYDEAAALYRRLLRWRSAPAVFRARVLNNLGFVYRRLGRYGVAERFYRRALAVEKAEGALHLVARTLNNLGGLSRMRGRLQESRDFFRRSGAIRKSIGDTLGLSSSLMNEGIVTAALGDTAAARRLVGRSCEIRRKAGAKGMLKEAQEEMAKL